MVFGGFPARDVASYSEGSRNAFAIWHAFGAIVFTAGPISAALLWLEGKSNLHKCSPGDDDGGGGSHGEDGEQSAGEEDILGIHGACRLMIRRGRSMGVRGCE